MVFAPVLRSLRSAWPQTRIVTLIRRAYVDLAPLLAPGIEWITTALDPVWIGEQTAEQAIVESGVLDQVNQILQENKERLDANA